MLATRYSLVASLLMMTSLSVACGNSDNALNTRKGERVLVSWLDKQDMHPEKVTCPEDIKMVVGTVFTCQATIANANSMVLDIEISTVSKTGDVRYKHLSEKLVSKQIERSLRGEFKDQQGAEFSIDCGLRVRPLVPGNTFNCQASDSESDTVHAIEVTMLSEAPFWSAKLTLP